MRGIKTHRSVEAKVAVEGDEMRRSIPGSSLSTAQVGYDTDIAAVEAESRAFEMSRVSTSSLKTAEPWTHCSMKQRLQSLPCDLTI